MLIFTKKSRDTLPIEVELELYVDSWRGHSFPFFLPPLPSPSPSPSSPLADLRVPLIFERRGDERWKTVDVENVA